MRVKSRKMRVKSRKLRKMRIKSRKMRVKLLGAALARRPGLPRPDRFLQPSLPLGRPPLRVDRVHYPRRLLHPTSVPPPVEASFSPRRQGFAFRSAFRPNRLRGLLPLRFRDALPLWIRGNRSAGSGAGSRGGRRRGGWGRRLREGHRVRRCDDRCLGGVPRRPACAAARGRAGGP